MKHFDLTEYVNLYLTSVPTPLGLTSREIVMIAIRFENPPRIPYSFITPLESDFFETVFLKRSNSMGLILIKNLETSTMTSGVMAEDLQTRVFFAHPYLSRGLATTGNTNGLIRH